MQQKLRGRARLYLLGRNANGVFIKSAPLTAIPRAGCRYMPGVSSQVISKKAVQFALKNLMPLAFGHISNDGYSEPHWGGNHGDAIYEHPGVPFISFSRGAISARSDTQRYEVAVVDDKFQVGPITTALERKIPAKSGSKRKSVKARI